MDRTFYYDRLYPLQDALLGRMRGIETGFYLTGGTAASRGYLQHRFSDDLDFFVNDDRRFGLWAERVLSGFGDHVGAEMAVLLREERFVRCEVRVAGIALKVEMVNDVPAHVGDVRDHPVLARLDSPENILANKVTALVDRQEPKDLADVWGFCTAGGLSLSSALRGAQGKAVGLFAPDVARVLMSATRDDWDLVRWIDPPDVVRWLSDLRALAERLVLHSG